MKKSFLIENNKENIKIDSRILISDEILKIYEDVLGIILHPHPLYGGSMDNNVVNAVKECLLNLGITCVTFNFRGVGKSTGTFNNGIGERNDLLNIVNFYLNKFKKIKRIILIGYSFGSIITLSAINEISSAIFAILISYPFGFMNISVNYNNNIPYYFIHGNIDKTASYSLFKSNYEKFTGLKSKYIIENADHFFFGFEDKITKYCSDIIKDYFKTT